MIAMKHSLQSIILKTIFDDEFEILDLGSCGICKKVPATQCRLNTWQPFKKSIVKCDKCSENTMF